jgi:hypothetical protein
MAIKSLCSIAVLTEDFAAKYAPTLLQLLSANLTAEGVKEEAFASASILAARWPAQSCSEEILNIVASAASTGM